MNGDCSAPARDDDPEEGSSTPAHDEPSATRLYRWTCPYCAKFGIQSATPEDVERYVVNALRTHVRSTDGGGHGPRQKLPDDVETAILENVRILATDD